MERKRMGKKAGREDGAMPGSVCAGMTRNEVRVRVAARWVGRFFVSRATASQTTGRAYGPGIWDIEVRVGRERKSMPYTGSHRETERTVRSMARRLCAREA